MATAQVDTPQFDLSTAVPETDDGKAISALPAFDLNSAVPEDSLQNARPQDNVPEAEAKELANPSPLSQFVRGFIKNVGKGGLEQYKEADAAFTNSQNIPTKQEGENDQDFEKRIEQFQKPLDEKEVAKGVMGQLGDSFNVALAAAAPEMSPVAWKTLGTFMLADKTRQAVQNIFLPNLSPTAKDVIDLAAFPIEGGMSHEAVTGIGNMISKAFTIKGVSPTIDLSPDVLKLWAEPTVTEKPAQPASPAVENFENEGGALDRLGISQNHYEVSQSTGMPVRVPISKIFNLTPDEVNQISTFEGEGGGQEQGVEKTVNGLPETGIETPQAKEIENATQGGESTQSGSNQTQGMVKEGEGEIRVRNSSQGGMETQAGEVEDVSRETSGERVTSKIAKSIEQKAVDAKLTDKFDTLAGEEKVNVAEQSKMATDLVNSNMDDARAIIRGEKPLPDRLRGISLITAMEEHLKNNPDGELANELANSPLVSGTTRAAQELRLAAEREPDSFTQKMKEINQAKIDAAGGQEKANKEIQKRVKIYKTETNKMNLSKDELNWERFLDKEVAC